MLHNNGQTLSNAGVCCRIKCGRNHGKICSTHASEQNARDLNLWRAACVLLICSYRRTYVRRHVLDHQVGDMLYEIQGHDAVRVLHVHMNDVRSSPRGAHARKPDGHKTLRLVHRWLLTPPSAWSAKRLSTKAATSWSATELHKRPAMERCLLHRWAPRRLLQTPLLNNSLIEDAQWLCASPRPPRLRGAKAAPTLVPRARTTLPKSVCRTSRAAVAPPPAPHDATGHPASLYPGVRSAGRSHDPGRRGKVWAALCGQHPGTYPGLGARTIRGSPGRGTKSGGRAALWTTSAMGTDSGATSADVEEEADVVGSPT